MSCPDCEERKALQKQAVSFTIAFTAVGLSLLVGLVLVVWMHYHPTVVRDATGRVLEVISS